MGKELKYIRIFELIDECRRKHDIRRGTGDDQPGRGLRPVGELHALRTLRRGDTRLRPGPAGLAVSRLRRGGTAGGGPVGADAPVPVGRPVRPLERELAFDTDNGAPAPGSIPGGGRAQPVTTQPPGRPLPATSRHCDCRPPGGSPAAFRLPPSARSGSLRSRGAGSRRQSEPNGF